ncbi:hypothetical protein AVEN_202068-1 [Araneus ventricosus]|uniref:Uncharacterized protein n=1 Tax=Araneus ventricosus TaxID=182803 RepID=A0A4Y2JZA3_ARAVE|nr:hypothetical protein AVEN_202068-1 [Araneus ventricosus]
MLENHTFDKKSEKPPGDHRLAVLLNTRGPDVFNFELDKQKKHSCLGVSLNCPGKDYLLACSDDSPNAPCEHHRHVFSSQPNSP